MPKFYFSRACDPNPLASKWLVSGVIHAETINDAKAQFDGVMSTLGTTDRSSSFSFVDLEIVEKSRGGLLAITMGGQ